MVAEHKRKRTKTRRHRGRGGARPSISRSSYIINTSARAAGIDEQACACHAYDEEEDSVDRRAGLARLLDRAFAEKK